MNVEVATSDTLPPPEGTDSYQPATLTAKLVPSGRSLMTVHYNCVHPASLTVSLLIDGIYYTNALPLLVDRGANVCVVFDKGQPASIISGERSVPLHAIVPGPDTAVERYFVRAPLPPAQVEEIERRWAPVDCSGVGFVPASIPETPNPLKRYFIVTDFEGKSATLTERPSDEPEPQRPEVEVEIDGDTYVVRPKLDITPYQSAMLAVFLRWEDEHYAVNVKEWLVEHDLLQHFRPVKEEKAPDDE